MRLPALAFGLVVAAGCAEQVDPVDFNLRAGSTADDGTGFVSIDPGADVPLISGAQGGFHVWVNLQVQGVAGDLMVRREARRVEDGQLVLRALPQVFTVPDDAMSDWWQSPAGAPAFMCPTPIGTAVVDHEIRIDIFLETRDGELVGQAELQLTPRCPEGDLADFCYEICSG